MNVDLNKEYFRMSFRFDQSKPEDFGLKESPNTKGLYIDYIDNSNWERAELYDYGWGNENGFIRLPKLGFDELWYLLVKSPVKDNRYGAAAIIEKQFSDSLLTHLLKMFGLPTFQSDDALKNAFKILKLDEARNRSDIFGKSSAQIVEDSRHWDYIATRVKAIINN